MSGPRNPRAPSKKVLPRGGGFDSGAPSSLMTFTFNDAKIAKIDQNYSNI